jgi:hypothetical protein
LLGARAYREVGRSRSPRSGCPKGSFRADAGTDVVVDILFFRKRKPASRKATCPGSTLDEVRPATSDEGAIRVNRWFARHPDFVLGTHALTSGPFGETYTCLPRAARISRGAAPMPSISPASGSHL